MTIVGKKLNTKGFTLLELMVVIAIIAVLVIIAIPQYSAHRMKAHNSAALSDIRNVKTSIESYFSDNGYYP